MPRVAAEATVVHPTGYWTSELTGSPGIWQVQSSSDTTLRLFRDSSDSPSRRGAILEFPVPSLADDQVITSAQLSFVGGNRTLFNRAEVRLLPTDQPVSASDAELSAGSLLAIYGYSGVVRFSMAQDVTDAVHSIAANGRSTLRVSINEATGLPWRNGSLALTSPTLRVETGPTRLWTERVVVAPGEQRLRTSFLTRAGKRYQLQSSLDLVRWEPALGVVFGTGGRVFVTNLVDPGSSLQAFRVITPGPLPDPGGVGQPGATTSHGEITCASVVQGEVGLNSPTNAFLFSGSPGQVVVLKAAMTSGEDDFFPRISIKSPSGQEIGGNSWLFSRLATESVMLAEGGVYRIEVSDDGRDGVQAGAFDLSLASLTEPCAKVIQPGMPVEGRLGSRASQDVWRFEAVAGDRVILKAVGTGADEAFLAALTVLSPLGQKVGGNSPLFGQPETGIITIPESGTYSAYVTESEWDGQQTGEYDLSLAVLSEPAARLLDCGKVVFDELKHPSEVHVWFFTAAAGDVVVSTAERRGGDRDFIPGLMIIGPSGQQVGGNSPLFGRTDTGMLRLTESGIHWVLIAESRWDGFQTGRYALALQSLTERCVRTLDLASPSEGTILDPIQRDYWRFQAKAGDALTLHVASMAAGGGDDWIATVQSWDGSWSRSPSRSAEPFVIPADGVYAVGIQTRDGVVGPYTLSLRPHLAVRLDRSASGWLNDWLHANARLQTVPTPGGPWTPLRHINRPFPMPSSEGAGFFRFVLGDSD
ncbi:MAG: hypothetical protein JNK85_25365 [Verrucomicrobiales bacterium]|nr:hypothetical protein [Verrucomicrobiales bacterium]